jgi:hypothetical protein
MRLQERIISYIQDGIEVSLAGTDSRAPIILSHRQICFSMTRLAGYGEKLLLLETRDVSSHLNALSSQPSDLYPPQQIHTPPTPPTSPNITNTKLTENVTLHFCDMSCWLTSGMASQRHDTDSPCHLQA